MKRYVVERELPRVGTLEREQLRQTAAKSSQALRELGGDIQWLETFIDSDRTFCVYQAKNEGIVQRYAELSGFAGIKVTEIGQILDVPTAPHLGS